MHGLGKPFGLLGDLFLLFPRKGGEGVVFGANQDGYGSLHPYKHVSSCMV
jgi:hypothetical protein